MRTAATKPSPATAVTPVKRRRTARLRAQLALLIADGSGVRDPRGGKRPGAGRPTTRARPSERHKRRPEVSARHPQHVVIRVVPTVGNLRRKHAYRALRAATVVTADKHTAFRICHISIQRTHVHLLVEADDRMALARGMQGFQVAAARRLNAAVDLITSRRARRRERAAATAQPTATVAAATRHRTGSRRVFADRYNAKPVTNPRQARNVLGYVLNNWKRHGEHTHAQARAWRVDPFSSAPQFTGWAGADGKPLRLPTARFAELGIDGPLRVKPPVTWLMRRGWHTDGEVHPADRPGRKPPTAL